MIELFGDATGNCVRAAIALEESGLPYRQCKVDLTSGEHRAAPFLQLNPVGRVPAIVDHHGPDDARLVLTQSNAILIYVSEKSGQLLPAAGASRAMALEWLFLFVTDVIAPNNQGFHLSRVLGTQLAPEVSQELTRRSLAMYGQVNEQLAGRVFIAGDLLTIADIAGYTITAALTDRLPWDDLPHVRRWFTELSRRPGFQRGMMAFR